MQNKLNPSHRPLPTWIGVAIWFVVILAALAIVAAECGKPKPFVQHISVESNDGRKIDVPCNDTGEKCTKAVIDAVDEVLHDYIAELREFAHGRFDWQIMCRGNLEFLGWAIPLGDEWGMHYDDEDVRGATQQETARKLLRLLKTNPPKHKACPPRITGN